MPAKEMGFVLEKQLPVIIHDRLDCYMVSDHIFQRILHHYTWPDHEAFFHNLL